MPAAANGRTDWASELRDIVETLLSRLLACGPRSSAEVAAALGARTRQVQSWLKRMVTAGSLLKTANPVQYQSAPIDAGTEGRRSPVPRRMIPDGRTSSLPVTPDTAWEDEFQKRVSSLLLKLLAEGVPPDPASLARTLEVYPSQARDWIDRLEKDSQFRQPDLPAQTLRSEPDQQAKML